MIPIKDYEELYNILPNGDVLNKKGKTLAFTVNKQTGYKAVSLCKNNKGSTKTIHRLVAEAYIPNPNNLPEVNHIDGNKLNNHVSNLEWVTPSENRQHAYDTGLKKAEKLFDETKYIEMLNRFLQGESMTALAQESSAGLTRITINLRNLAIQQDLLEKFEAQLKEQKRIRNTQANETKKQAIKQFTKEGVLITVHNSITAAAKSLGKSTTGPICNALSGKAKSGYGYLWERV